MERLDLLTTFIQCINRLFFHNSVRVNVNGQFTGEVLHTRELRQGDPLPSLLFNLIIEFLLLSI